MIIALGHDVKLGVCDIESLGDFFDCGTYDPDTGQWTEFEVSEYRNDLYKFVKWYTSRPVDYLVTFNGIGYDQQVLQYIVDKHQEWTDLTSKEIAETIKRYSNWVIDSQNYRIPLRYKEEDFSIPPLDVFRIHHFDNEAKRTSLKWCEYMLNLEVEEMPIEHTHVNITQEEIELVKSYRRKDVMATLQVFKLTLGDIDLPELAGYKGKNKIQDRFDVMAETGLKCLNWSDVKIGEEWNKKDYMDVKRLRDDKELFPKKITPVFGQKFKKFFPKTMKFQTPEMLEFVKNLGETYVLAKKQEFPLKYGDQTYVIAKGGIHSNEKNRKLAAGLGFFLRDADVGSQYPNSIMKLKTISPHLDVDLLISQVRGKVEKRIDNKARAKKLKELGNKEDARPLDSIQEMLKLCLNGGLYGKLGQPGSFLEYPEGLLKVCIGNQIEILMLIEMMTLAGFEVMSGNTDGIVVKFPSEHEDKYKQVCQEWEELVGNSFLGKLEYADFVCMWQDSINSYIAKKTDGSAKKKGKFLTEFELNKNKSKRIIALALEVYFIDGKDPIEFIKKHDNIYDFCIGKKAWDRMHYEELAEQTIVHKKLIRYYISTEGNVFMKRGFAKNKKTGDYEPINNYCEAPSKDYFWLGEPKLRYFNTPFETKDYKIDYRWYIMQTLERIDNIEKTHKARSYANSFKPQLQTSMF